MRTIEHFARLFWRYVTAARKTLAMARTLTDVKVLGDDMVVLLVSIPRSAVWQRCWCQRFTRVRGVPGSAVAFRL